MRIGSGSGSTIQLPGLTHPPYLDGLEALRHLESVAGELLLPLPAGQLTVQHLLLQLLHPLKN